MTFFIFGFILFGVSLIICSGPERFLIRPPLAILMFIILFMILSRVLLVLGLGGVGAVRVGGGDDDDDIYLLVSRIHQEDGVSEKKKV